MIKNRPLGHIGLATTDLEATAKWYEEVLGFQEIGAFTTPDGVPVRFLRSGDTVYGIFQPKEGPAAPGHIDHYSYASSDIEADFRFCQEQGYTFEEPRISFLPFWEKGCRYFKILSPSGEAIEFCQIL